MTEKIVLGIETSCDETSAAIVSSKNGILSNIVYSQIREHEKYRGIVPEIAARAHLDCIEEIVKESFFKANVKFDQLDAVAATCGPGLIGGLIVGSTFAKTLSFCFNKIFIPINHLFAHGLTVRLENEVNFPYLLLLASGGHCMFCIVNGVDDFQVIGKSIDDSIGECFDKTGKILGLGYPGGPAIEVAAKNGNCHNFVLPRPLMKSKNCNFSFSGLKTAAKNMIIENKIMESPEKISDFCASFQHTISEIVVDRAKFAISICENFGITPNAFVISGGVGANTKIRLALSKLAEICKIPFLAPKNSLCTDNGAMIAHNGIEILLNKNNVTSQITFKPFPKI